MIAGLRRGLQSREGSLLALEGWGLGKETLRGFERLPSPDGLIRG